MKPSRARAIPRPRQKTSLGAYFIGDSPALLTGSLGSSLRGKVRLVLTSPPYPLNRKKSYGNLKGDEYREWFVALAPILANLLTPDGSIVIELGNAWLPGRPVQSLLHLESLIGFVNNGEAGLRLCQQFICYNPSRLPTPAAWVTVRPERVTDSFTHVWWMAKTDFPRADNRRVLRPYGQAMESLLRRRSYNHGVRPSQHRISKNGFNKDRGGSLPHNVFELEPLDPGRSVRLPNAFSFSNTLSSDHYHRQCRNRGIAPHPARMPAGLASFFIQFLTRPGDLVLDPFAGSNTTGFVAQVARRRWIAIDRQAEYLAQSRIRFKDPLLSRARATR
jgi:site-specific DNA-methyltransferase (cytosine-N4-specific)